MTILEVVGTAPINGNTTVVVKGSGDVLKNGIGILDGEGKPYQVISVGMSSPDRAFGKTTVLLVGGNFSSNRMFV